MNTGKTKLLRELIKKFLHEYTGTGASGGNAGDGNNITSPRPFPDDKSEIQNYTNKNVYGAEGGHYVREPAFHNPNRHKMTKFEQLTKTIKEIISEQVGLDGSDSYGYATLTSQGQAKSRFTRTGRPPGIWEENEQEGPSYNENWLKDKLGNPVKDVYKFDNNRGHIDIYPDLGNSQYIDRSSQFIRFELKEGEVHFVSAFGYEKGYDMLKSVLPELPPMGNSSYVGFMNVLTDEETIPVGIDTANKMIDAVRGGLDAETGAQSDFYSREPGTGGTGIDEQTAIDTKRKNISSNIEVDFYDKFSNFSKLYKEIWDTISQKNPISPFASYYESNNEAINKVENLIMGIQGDLDDVFSEMLEEQNSDTIRRQSNIKGRTKQNQDDEIKIAKNSVKDAEKAFSQSSNTSGASVRDAEQNNYSEAKDVRIIKRAINKLKNELESLKNVPEPNPVQIKRMEEIPTLITTEKEKLPKEQEELQASNKALDQAKSSDTSSKVQGSAAVKQARTTARDIEKNIRKAQQQIQTPMAENLYNDYINKRKNKNLMKFMDSYKLKALNEGAVKKFFKMYDDGRTSEEIMQYYAKEGIQIPEQFLGKVKKQYENYQKLKLEMELADNESKEFKKIPLTDENFEYTEESKKLASGLTKENKIVKKYPIPPEIEEALVNTLKMDPLVRFVKNLKAVNSIPPSYRIFLLNGQHFDIIYEGYSLMAKIGIDEYYLADVAEKNYAIKHINKLMTKPIMKKGEDLDDIEGGLPPSPSGGETPPKTPTPEPEA